DGNDYSEEYEELRFVQKQILIVKLKVEEPYIVFQPSLQQCWELIHRGFMEIIKSAESLPRVESSLFPDIKEHNLTLRTVNPDEDLVADLVNRAMELWKEIASLHITVPLSMFCLDAANLNQDLCNRTRKLKDTLIAFQVDENRELNKGICRRYDEIAETVSKTPENTEELVALNKFLKKSIEVTIHKLKVEIGEASNRLEFLMDFATLP
ncbi:hypothetical protein JZ751_026278, partial [Albula glossodonta]